MADERPLGGSRSEYLAAVGSQLHLPPLLERERLEEVAAHLDDTIEALVAAGLDADRAERESMARLGPPRVLGDQLRRAEQTRARTLAAVGGAIISAGGGVVRGGIIGLAALFAALIGGALVISAVGSISGLEPPQFNDSAANTAVLAVAGWAAFFVAGRSAVQAAAANGRRRVADVRPPVALAGIAAGILLIVSWRGTQSWLSVGALAVLPLFAAVGASRARERTHGAERHSRWWLAALVFLVVVPTLLLATSRGRVSGPDTRGHTYASLDEMWHATGWDRVGRSLEGNPASERFTDALQVPQMEVAGGSHEAVAVAHVSASQAAGWTNLRLEAWRSTPDPSAGPEIETTATGPDRAVPLTETDGALTATVRLDDRPGAEMTWAVLTGVDASATRYVLARDFARSPFYGTALDWIVAIAR